MLSGTFARALICALLLECVSSTLVAVAATSGKSATASGERVLLPAIVTPEHYRIDIIPDIDHDLTFQGFRGDRPGRPRSHRQYRRSTAPTSSSRARRCPARRSAPAIAYDDKAQTATFTFGRSRAEAAAPIHLDARRITARSTSRPRGCLRWTTTRRGQGAGALFTQFENSDARRFVPSWDEPGRKASFELTADRAGRTTWPFPTCRSRPAKLLGDGL
jgi:aminopeptidase N